MPSKVLVIVETPAKAKTLQALLGPTHEVKPSQGHLVDLPKSKLGVAVDEGFCPHYITIRGKGKLLKALKADARKAKGVLFATDPDREGEFLAWQLARAFELPETLPCRVVLGALTAEAVAIAFAAPVPLNRDLVEGHQARRVVDRLVGYQISPLLWKHLRWGLSAGRVQSAVLHLLAERDRAVESFRRREVWSLAVEVAGDAPKALPLELRAVDEAGEELHLAGKSEADSLLLGLRSEAYVLREVGRRNERDLPPPAFDTASLLVEAARRLGFSARKTMVVAQQLYEGIELGRKGPEGLVTFPRSTSTAVPSAEIEAVRRFVLGRWGEDHLPEPPEGGDACAGAPGPSAREQAIRPTDASRRPRDVKKALSPEQYELYRLIWCRFVASVMAPAVFLRTKMRVEAGETRFAAEGLRLAFDGHRRAYEKHDDLLDPVEERELPRLRQGDRLRLRAERPERHYTRGPELHTEASLVEAVAEAGMGRPATMAALVATLLDRRYAERRKERLVITELGRTVAELLEARFPEIVDPEATAALEARLDGVARGAEAWTAPLTAFNESFKLRLAEAEEALGKAASEEAETDIRCPECGAAMWIRMGRYGKFLACSAYPECRHTSELAAEAPAAEPAPVPDEAELLDEACELCGSPMQVRRGRYGRFKACSNYPSCRNTSALLNPIGLPCPVEGCSGEVVSRFTRKKRMFYGCSRYPSCAFSSWVRPAEGSCPLCGRHLVEKRAKERLEAIVCSDKACPFQKTPEGDEPSEG